MSLSLEVKIMEKLPLEMTVFQFFGATPELIFSESRLRKIVKIRQVAQWLRMNENLRYKGKPLLKEITKLYPRKNNRNIDHATIYYSFHTVENHMDSDEDFRQEIYDLQKHIFGRVKYF